MISFESIFSNEKFALNSRLSSHQIKRELANRIVMPNSVAFLIIHF